MKTVETAYNEYYEWLVQNEDSNAKTHRAIVAGIVTEFNLGPEDCAQFCKQTGVRRLKLAQPDWYDFNFTPQVGEEIIVRWTTSGNYYEARGEVYKVNPKTVNVHLTEEVPPYPPGQSIQVPYGVAMTEGNGIQRIAGYRTGEIPSGEKVYINSDRYVGQGVVQHSVSPELAETMVQRDAPHMYQPGKWYYVIDATPGYAVDFFSEDELGHPSQAARYSGDPRWIHVKWPTTCTKCNRQIQQGEEAFYYPNGKQFYCDQEGCGKDAERDFGANIFDEDFGGSYGAKKTAEVEPAEFIVRLLEDEGNIGNPVYIPSIYTAAEQIHGWTPEQIDDALRMLLSEQVISRDGQAIMLTSTMDRSGAKTAEMGVKGQIVDVLIESGLDGITAMEEADRIIKEMDQEPPGTERTYTAKNGIALTLRKTAQEWKAYQVIIKTEVGQIQGQNTQKRPEETEDDVKRRVAQEEGVRPDDIILKELIGAKRAAVGPHGPQPGSGGSNYQLLEGSEDSEELEIEEGSLGVGQPIVEPTPSQQRTVAMNENRAREYAQERADYEGQEWLVLRARGTSGQGENDWGVTQTYAEPELDPGWEITERISPRIGAKQADLWEDLLNTPDFEDTEYEEEKLDKALQELIEQVNSGSYPDYIVRGIAENNRVDESELKSRYEASGTQPPFGYAPGYRPGESYGSQDWEMSGPPENEDVVSLTNTESAPEDPDKEEAGMGHWTNKTTFWSSKRMAENKTVEQGVDELGHWATIRDEYGDVESATIGNDETYIKEWLREHGVEAAKKAQWDESMPQVMDRETAEHFYAWLESTVHMEDQHEVEQVIHKLLQDHPNLVETHTWPEMRELAERNYSSEASKKTAQQAVAFEDTEVDTWFERDRASVVLRDKATQQETYAEWWDEDVQQAVEDGFLDPNDWHGSAYRTAVERGLIREAAKIAAFSPGDRMIVNPEVVGMPEPQDGYWVGTVSEALDPRESEGQVLVDIEGVGRQYVSQEDLKSETGRGWNEAAKTAQDDPESPIPEIEPDEGEYRDMKWPGDTEDDIEPSGPSDGFFYESSKTADEKQDTREYLHNVKWEEYDELQTQRPWINEQEYSDRRTDWESRHDVSAAKIAELISIPAANIEEALNRLSNMNPRVSRDYHGTNIDVEVDAVPQDIQKALTGLEWSYAIG